ncbi:MAG: 2-polyprenyl-3-methyl-5-hydroxy-6-metoxy-1,4-benzoquinol methylase, partial [Francisellaceae bacterium]
MTNETLNQRIKTLLLNDKKIDIKHLYTQLSSKKFKLNLNENYQLELYSEALKQSVSIDFNSSIFKNKIDPKKAKLPTIKAIEGRVTKTMNILDGTAGLGSDCFSLASRGHTVTAIEQDLVIFLLLKDGISRAELIFNLSKIAENLQLINTNVEE